MHMSSSGRWIGAEQPPRSAELGINSASLSSRQGRSSCPSLYNRPEYFDLDSGDHGGHPGWSDDQASACGHKLHPRTSIAGPEPAFADCPGFSQSSGSIDIEAACNPWSRIADDRRPRWPRWSLFGSNLEYQVRNPTARGAISFNIRHAYALPGFLLRWLLFAVYCLLIAFNYERFAFLRWFESSVVERGSHESGPALIKNARPENSMMLVWAETLLGTGACFLLAQGYFGWVAKTSSSSRNEPQNDRIYRMRATRERMERVRQTAVTLAYSFLKTTNADSQLGHTNQELQLVI